MIAYVGIALPYNYLPRLLPPILANANNDDILLMFLLLYTTNITSPIIIVVLCEICMSTPVVSLSNYFLFYLFILLIIS